jgi:hypothetical protein
VARRRFEKLFFEFHFRDFPRPFSEHFRSIFLSWGRFLEHFRSILGGAVFQNWWRPPVFKFRCGPVWSMGPFLEFRCGPKWSMGPLSLHTITCTRSLPHGCPRIAAPHGCPRMSSLRCRAFRQQQGRFESVVLRQCFVNSCQPTSFQKIAKFWRFRAAWRHRSFLMVFWNSLPKTKFLRKSPRGACTDY